MNAHKRDPVPQDQWKAQGEAAQHAKAEMDRLQAGFHKQLKELFGDRIAIAEESDQVFYNTTGLTFNEKEVFGTMQLAFLRGAGYAGTRASHTLGSEFELKMTGYQSHNTFAEMYGSHVKPPEPVEFPAWDLRESDHTLTGLIQYRSVDVLREALKGMLEMHDYLSKKINWGASAMDAKAIRLMNEAPVAAKNALEFLDNKEKGDVDKVRIDTGICSLEEIAESRGIGKMSIFDQMNIPPSDITRLLSLLREACRVSVDVVEVLKGIGATARDFETLEALVAQAGLAGKNV